MANRMNILLIFSSTSLFLLTLAMLVYEWFIRYRWAVRERLNDLSGELTGQDEVLLFKNVRHLHSKNNINELSWNGWLQQIIDQAGIQWTPRSLLVSSTIACAATILSAAWFSWWLAVLVGPLGGCIPLIFLLWRRRSRQRKLCRQLPEAFSMISRAVRAGQTVPTALQIIAEDFDPPISSEFALCYEQQNLGMSRESALRRLANRSGIMELQLFVIAVLVQAKSGGDLVELLDNLSAMIRKRLKLKDRVRGLTGEGRMQAVVLILLPILAFLGIVFLAPDYASELLERPWLMACTACAQVLGAYWIHMIVDIDY